MGALLNCLWRLQTEVTAMRLIDAGNAKASLDWTLIGDAADAACRVIDNAPTVDAVVVTRCKDCRYRGLICCPAIHETIGNGLVDYAVDNGYCWCGKPKET